MSNLDEKYEFGLEITRVNKGYTFKGELAVHVRVVRRAIEEHDKKQGYLWLGLTGAYPWGYAKNQQGLNFNELELRGHIFESSSNKGEGERDRYLIGNEPRYFAPYSVELREAESYVKTLRRFSALREKWKDANPTLEVTPAVVFLLLAKLTDAKFAIYRDCSTSQSWRPHSEDELLTIPQGVHKYLAEIEHLKEVWVGPWKPRAVA
jgi:hypothetical protein